MLGSVTVGLLFIPAAAVILLTHTASTKSLPAVRGGRGFDASLEGARRLRRELRDLLPYEADMMSYPTRRDALYNQPEEWKGRALGQALQRLVESDQRQEQQEEEEQAAAYLANLLRLLNEAKSVGLVGPGAVGLVEEEEEERPGDFQEPPDYDETSVIGNTQTAWRMQPRIDRMDPEVAQALLDRIGQDRLQARLGAQRTGTGLDKATDQETLRYLVAKILSSIGPDNRQVSWSAAQPMRTDLSDREPAHRRTRRSLDDAAPASPSSDPPLIRVKRLEEVEEGYGDAVPTALQRMKRIDTMVTGQQDDELHHGGRRRRRRAAVNYDPRLLAQQILQYIQ